MDVVKTRYRYKRGWSHRAYVRPSSFKESVALYIRGYRRLNNCMLGFYGWYSHDKHKLY